MTASGPPDSGPPCTSEALPWLPAHTVWLGPTLRLRITWTAASGGGALLVFTPRPSPALRERGPVYGDVAAHISRAVTAPGGGPQRDTIGCHIIYTPGIVGVLPGRHPRKQRRGPRPQDCTPRWSVSEKGPFWEHVPGACRCGGCVTGGEAVT